MLDNVWLENTGSPQMICRGEKKKKKNDDNNDNTGFLSPHQTVWSLESRVWISAALQGLEATNEPSIMLLVLGPELLPAHTLRKLFLPLSVCVDLSIYLILSVSRKLPLGFFDFLRIT